MQVYSSFENSFLIKELKELYLIVSWSEMVSQFKQSKHKWLLDFFFKCFCQFQSKLYFETQSSS